MKEWICREISTSTRDAENGILTMETELIRCKDCKWQGDETECPMFDPKMMKVDDFCSYGERKEK